MIKVVELRPAFTGYVASETYRVHGVTGRWIFRDTRSGELFYHHLVALAGLTLAVPVLEDGGHALAPSEEDFMEGLYL
jgi:hypothetical protein